MGDDQVTSCLPFEYHGARENSYDQHSAGTHKPDHHCATKVVGMPNALLFSNGGPFSSPGLALGEAEGGTNTYTRRRKSRNTNDNNNSITSSFTMIKQRGGGATVLAHPGILVELHQQILVH